MSFRIINELLKDWTPMKNILIVDDEIEVAETINDIINSTDHLKSRFVTSAEAAMHILKEETFDLVITDVFMPQINGIELIDHIHANYPELRILACSGGRQSGALIAGMALDQAMEEGADNAILKPFTPEQLLAKVDNLLD